ncbi:unnamed protein product [Acanthoscelides obtectus]|uniref:Hyaluronan mediated motility receptor n=1 Tax=Acanthoscelides obtectus TaxID=200917 RepID=A0A9P0JRE7_ACAOB|nr:unnamed protein product [Acanthoscelides obtectus]CAK1668076.1 hypothetical protein AOBTE_LOCUS26210 [Acanthoscelides obtectus]
MSFGKAKIQRFNDIRTQAPSPTSYNVERKLKLETKNKVAKYTVVTNNDGDKNSVKSDGFSARSVPIMKTPLAAKCKKFYNRIQPKTPKRPEPESIAQIEALKEKIVECNNKDTFIKELSEQIDELKDNINQLKKEKVQIEADKKSLEESVNELKIRHHLDLENVIKENEIKLGNLAREKDELLTEIDHLKQQCEDIKNLHKTELELIQRVQDELTTELSKKEEALIKLEVKYAEAQKKNPQVIDVGALEREINELHAEIAQFKQKYEEKEHSHKKEIHELIHTFQDEKASELLKKEKALHELEAKYAETQKKSQQEIDAMRQEHQREIQDLEFEMLKAMTELQKEREDTEDRIREVEEEMRREIKVLQEKFAEEKRLLHEESTRKIKEIEQHLKEANYQTEKQLKGEMEQIIVEWRNKLQTQQAQSDAILKECQAISEYNIIQSEVEKNNVKLELEKINEEHKAMQHKYHKIVSEYNKTVSQNKELQAENSKIVQELNDIKVSWHEKLENKNAEISKLNKDKATYEYTIKNSQTTINVLKERLIHSDRDVEQLKQELVQCESKILYYEDRYIKLESDLKERQSSNDELELQFDSAIRLNYSEISQLSNELFKKLDQYKKEGMMYHEKYKKEKQLKEEIMNQLKDAFDLINKVKLELDALEMFNTQYEFEIDQYQNELDDYHMREMDWSLMKDKFEDIIAEMQQQLEKKDSEIKVLSNKLHAYEEKLSSNVNYTEYYENKIKEYERELNDSGNIHKKYIEMSGKYDELAQRFEELEMENMKIKSKIGNLANEGEEQRQWENKYQKQKKAYDRLLNKYQNLEKEVECNKVIQKVGKENAEPKSSRKSKLLEGNKENVSSPNRLLNSSRLESPLRERN